MSKQYDCFRFFAPLYCLTNAIIPINDTNNYKKIFSDKVVPEIWHAAWHLWKIKIIKQYNKSYLLSFIHGFFMYLKMYNKYYEDMNDNDLKNFVFNRKHYFPASTKIVIEYIIPGLVYRISAVNNAHHIKKGPISHMIYKRYIMNHVYYYNEEIPQRGTDISNDININNWIITSQFYYDYKNPSKTRIIYV